jgi:hypothetical protein
MAVQVGATMPPERSYGGKGVLLGGVPGVEPRRRVVILGGGVVGTNAAKIAVGMGAQVTVLDIDAPRRWRYLEDVFGRRHRDALQRTRHASSRVRARADLVIGAVLVTGARAPKLVTPRAHRAHGAGLGRRRRRRRPGRLHRDVPPHHARRPDLRRRRRRALLRRQHARRGLAHVHALRSPTPRLRPATSPASPSPRRTSSRTSPSRAFSEHRPVTRLRRRATLPRHRKHGDFPRSRAPPAREVRALGHTIPEAALVTAEGHAKRLSESGGLVDVPVRGP